MKRWVVTAALASAAIAPLGADLTIVQTMSMEGPMAAMAGGNLPKVTMRIKGAKARSDVEVGAMNLVAITDLAQNHLIVLNAQARTAQVITPATAAAGGPKFEAPQIEASFESTGKTQTIEGQLCHEHKFSMTMNMAELAGQGQVPPETAAMMQDVRMLMNGSVWTARDAPGAEEYVSYMKQAMGSGLFAALSGMKTGQAGGFDKLMAAAGSAPGLPYLTEVTMTMEGTGPMVEAMSQMGPMKMIQRVTSVSTDALSDELFTIPEGYAIEKR